MRENTSANENLVRAVLINIIVILMYIWFAETQGCLGELLSSFSIFNFDPELMKVPSSSLTSFQTFDWSFLVLFYISPHDGSQRTIEESDLFPWSRRTNYVNCAQVRVWVRVRVWILENYVNGASYYRLDWQNSRSANAFIFLSSISKCTTEIINNNILCTYIIIINIKSVGNTLF